VKHDEYPPHADVTTVMDHVKYVDTKEYPHMHQQGYKPWKRLQIECRSGHGLRLYIDMTWSMGRPFDNDMGVDYHCNRLRYHPLGRTFSLAPCVDCGGVEDEKQVEDIEAESRLFTLEEVFQQVYEKRAITTRRRQLLLNARNIIAKLKHERMTKQLAFTVVPSVHGP
jgi:hypothetical protein